MEHIIQHSFCTEGLLSTGLAKAFSACDKITFDLCGLMILGVVQAGMVNQKQNVI